MCETHFNIFTSFLDMEQLHIYIYIYKLEATVGFVTDFKFSLYFIDDVDSALGYWHQVDIGNGSNVLEEHSDSIFCDRACRMGMHLSKVFQEP